MIYRALLSYRGSCMLSVAPFIHFSLDRISKETMILSSNSTRLRHSNKCHLTSEKSSLEQWVIKNNNNKKIMKNSNNNKKTCNDCKILFSLSMKFTCPWKYEFNILTCDIFLALRQQRITKNKIACECILVSLYRPVVVTADFRSKRVILFSI